MPQDHFSVRWTREIAFEEGTYRFYASVDDGMRLWVDGQQVIDAWYNSQLHTVSGDHVLAGAGAQRSQAAQHEILPAPDQRRTAHQRRLQSTLGSDNAIASLR